MSHGGAQEASDKSRREHHYSCLTFCQDLLFFIERLGFGSALQNPPHNAEAKKSENVFSSNQVKPFADNRKQLPVTSVPQGDIFCIILLALS